LFALLGFELIVGEFHDLAADLPQQSANSRSNSSAAAGDGPRRKKANDVLDEPPQQQLQPSQHFVIDCRKRAAANRNGAARTRCQ
jgi:hypothetical protein